ncbi:MAG: hypothetical protein AAGG01_22970 [Planctomycetota bacterium]
MSRIKKLGLGAVVLVCLIAAMVAILDRSGRPGRLTPAAVPVVGDPFAAGSAALDAGDYPVALGYFLQVPKTDHSYNRAQRYIGWEMYAEELGLPATGLSYVHRALIDEPFSSNSWEDAFRTYGALFSGRGGRAKARAKTPTGPKAASTK